MDPQRMFLAVRPPLSAVAELQLLDRPADAGVRWENPANWHITIRFFPQAPVDGVIAAVGGSGPLGAPTVVLGPAVALLGRSVVIVPAAGLRDLAAAVEKATEGLARAAGSHGRPYIGHLTLGRLRRGSRTCNLVGQRIDARFLARELELVVSTPQAGGGHRHDVVHRWGLPLP